MNRAEALAAYDAQLRRGARATVPGARVERDGPVVRYVNDDAASWHAVLSADIDDATAHDAIRAQVAFFRGLGRSFEWKYHAYDMPANLPARLLAAGFEPGLEESLMVAETAALATGLSLPDGVRLAPVMSTTGVDLVVRVHEEVFGQDHGWLRPDLLTRLNMPRPSGVAMLAIAGRRPVSGARVEFHEGTDFASLWGGGTVPEWRGRGIYRALVACRAQMARDRGFRYLQVDASPESRPILERLGFRRLTTTTPYVWRPS